MNGLELSCLGIEKDGERMSSSGENTENVLMWRSAVGTLELGCLGSNGN